MSFPESIDVHICCKNVVDELRVQLSLIEPLILRQT